MAQTGYSPTIKHKAMQPVPLSQRSRPSSSIRPCTCTAAPTSLSVRARAVTEASSAAEAISINPAYIKPVQCLKEWAPACAALGHGQQTILLRKGGIREPTFTPKAQQFLLFPTSFHTEGQLLKPGIAERYQQEMQMEPKQMPQIPLRYFAKTTGVWTTKDPRILQQLDPLHVYAEGFLETRLKWRSKDPLTLLELRCYVLEPELLVPAREQYFGCFSWVELLPEDAGLAAADAGAGTGSSKQRTWQLRPALSDEEFLRQQQYLRHQLQQLDVSELAL
eukprot:GHUV01009763.1.p1 GENE.GHUV01009763.1~~GHUV01009763.1.p1  ORF type:complete len:278 (+),score=73.38 GHUV01009763.1:139-972(+)